MTEDDTQAAWHQLEVENWQRELDEDEAYQKWLDEITNGYLLMKQQKDYTNGGTKQ